MQSRALDGRRGRPTENCSRRPDSPRRPTESGPSARTREARPSLARRASPATYRAPSSPPAVTHSQLHDADADGSTPAPCRPTAPVASPPSLGHRPRPRASQEIKPLRNLLLARSGASSGPRVHPGASGSSAGPAQGRRLMPAVGVDTVRPARPRRSRRPPTSRMASPRWSPRHARRLGRR